MTLPRSLRPFLGNQAPEKCRWSSSRDPLRRPQGVHCSQSPGRGGSRWRPKNPSLARDLEGGLVSLRKFTCGASGSFCTPRKVRNRSPGQGRGRRSAKTRSPPQPPRPSSLGPAAPPPAATGAAQAPPKRPRSDADTDDPRSKRPTGKPRGSRRAREELPVFDSASLQPPPAKKAKQAHPEALQAQQRDKDSRQGHDPYG